MPVTEARNEWAMLADELGAALRDAGTLALKTFRGEIKSWTKGKDSPVSEADIAVDHLLRARLERPGFAWFSEESHDDHSRLAQRRLYIVDPIDGTRSYLAGRPDWSISAALVEDGRPIVAAVYVPVDAELFLAVKGEGATLNGAPIMISAGNSLDGARIAAPAMFLDRLTKLDSGIVKEPKIHSLALRLTRVAQGRIDGAMASIHAYDWDLAAADLLVHEAGGMMTDVAGRALVYNLQDPVHGAVLAASRARHAAMIDLIGSRQTEFSRQA